MKIYKFIILAVVVFSFVAVPAYALEITDEQRQVTLTDLYSQNKEYIESFAEENKEVYPYASVTYSHSAHSSGTPLYCSIHVSLTNNEPIAYGSRLRTDVNTNLKYLTIVGTYDGDLKFVSQTTDINENTLGAGVDVRSGKIYKTNYTLYNATLTDGTYTRTTVYQTANFMTPLYQEMMELTGATFQTTTVPEVVSTMMILTLSGVGLMALLMVLPLLGKTFNRYRS